MWATRNSTLLRKVTSSGLLENKNFLPPTKGWICFHSGRTRTTTKGGALTRSKLSWPPVILVVPTPLLQLLVVFALFLYFCCYCSMLGSCGYCCAWWTVGIVYDTGSWSSQWRGICLVLLLLLHQWDIPQSSRELTSPIGPSRTGVVPRPCSPRASDKS